MPVSDKVFEGSVPKVYEELMVPLIFEPYAVDLSRRMESHRPGRVLEIACGTGVVTRRLAESLPAGSTLVATDLNQAMLDVATAAGTKRLVEFRKADALALPFGDGEFDAVVCQFGVMFFPDKAKGFSEARRVLRPGGVFLFNVWDRIEENEFAAVVDAELEKLFPADPPHFMARTPHGYYQRATIERDIAAGGFSRAPKFDTVAARSKAASAHIASTAYCQGTPLRNEIEVRDKAGLQRATDACARALVNRFGSGAVNGKIQAHVIEVQS